MLAASVPTFYTHTHLFADFSDEFRLGIIRFCSHQTHLLLVCGIFSTCSTHTSPPNYQTVHRPQTSRLRQSHEQSGWPATWLGRRAWWRPLLLAHALPTVRYGTSLLPGAGLYSHRRGPAQLSVRGGGQGAFAALETGPLWRRASTYLPFVRHQPGGRAGGCGSSLTM